MATSADADRRRSGDLHHLRMLAWCVMRDKYRAEPRRTDGGRRGTARIVTLTFYLEEADYLAAYRAVGEIVVRRGGGRRSSRRGAEGLVPLSRLRPAGV